MQTNFKNINADFTCKHCGYVVSTQKAASGVVNRNHCPLCLYSLHVDLFKAGDRLCACKALMVPVGLTFKHSQDKFSHHHQGELMLVHRCTYCGDLSINRMAADDDPYQLMVIFEQTPSETQLFIKRCQQQNITLAKNTDRPIVQTRLFGNPSHEIPSLTTIGSQA